MTAPRSPSLRLLDRPQWEALVGRFADHSYRQQWQFGLACASRLGATSEHVAIERSGQVVGLADVRCKRVPLLGTGVAYVNGGPLTQLDGAASLVELEGCLRALVSEYVQRRAMVLRIAPPLGEVAWNGSVAEAFERLGFLAVAPSVVRRYRTLLVDIRDPLPAIRARLAQKWRNCLNRAERNGLEIRFGDDDDLFSTFVGLYQELSERKQFSTELDAAFYRAVQRRTSPCERLHVAIASFEGRPAAGVVASLIGQTAVYLLGASNATGMEQKAAYLLQWHVIEQARARGCRWYDLGGIDPDGNAGVYHFKVGLGGVDVTAPGPFEYRPNGLRGRLVGVAERAYRWLRKSRLGSQGDRTSAASSPVESPK